MGLLRRTRYKPKEIAKGVAAGLVGGLVASWVMNQFQSGWSKLAEHLRDGDEHSPRQRNESPDATMIAADKLSRAVRRRGLSREQQKKAGPVVHYAFGTAVGALYGAAVETDGRASYGFGLPYGTAVFLGADEAAVPALGLSKSPTQYPLSTHAYALASHLVYGATLEAVRRMVRPRL